LIRVPSTKNPDVGCGWIEMATMHSSTFATATAVSKAPLLWLALGSFAIGTEGFMIAPLLPDIAFAALRRRTEGK
jgi:hypothetical protein